MAFTNIQDNPATFKISLPEIGFARLPQILAVVPVSKSTWWSGVKDGRYPAAVKLGPRTTAWRVEDIRNLIKRLSTGGAA
jgi:prophage regulatory protein